VRRIAVSGHRALTEPTILGVTMAIQAALHEIGTAVRGLSCLAAGADQIFARAVLEAGGQVEAIVPAARYPDGMRLRERAGYAALLPPAAAGRPTWWPARGTAASPSGSSGRPGPAAASPAARAGRPAGPVSRPGSCRRRR
jgi:hypothetical protein